MLFHGDISIDTGRCLGLPYASFFVRNRLNFCTDLPVDSYEKNVSTQQSQKGAHPWFSCPYGHPQRSQGTEGTQSQGTCPSGALTVRRLLPSEEGATFPRSRRLLKPDEYRRVFNDGRRSADRHFLVLALPNGLIDARLGLAVSKKTSRRAVERNRIKRLIRESFRLHQRTLCGLDLVVVSRSGAAGSDNSVCFDSLRQHWRRVAVKCVDF